MRRKRPSARTVTRHATRPMGPRAASGTGPGSAPCFEPRRLSRTAERRLSANQHDELESLHARVRKLEAELAGARPPPPISHRPPPVVAQPPITPPPTTSCRDDGDPLNGCLR